ncbi:MULTISPECIES: 2-keto-4-pentenoate hydratase [Pseudomonadaceae]|uniref:2-keto-4-pentenoate hydratase n=1 Tax=Pseudomonadaceae TaxID=135621 RepID=UPI00103D4B88|nr:MULTISPECIES: fumarylacetoacetate hydrolase family protein [Pseudomonadaceae]MBA1276287.1 2-keto-4-pentenoate hydratase [Stutzerimonas stutzeri]MBC8648795.1 2-keto-4-pentenoate hydratase [Pseudomonas sp. MT4]QXY92768.1 2-keto-4-pentenoate hydratase [Pseudomonas sp. MTM4]TCD22421.1 2-keto-4-pentenoate hydratase [Pseudomonas sp. IC_126]
MKQTISDARLLAAASSLAVARSQRQPGPRVSETFALASLDEAYQVQTAGLQLALTEGRSLSGVKAGLTSVALRAALKVEEPLYGWLYADTACRSGATIAWESLLQPKVEIELALLLAHDLPAGEISQEQLLASIAGVIPALEINDSAIDGWQLTMLDAVADNLSSGLYVLGNQTVPLAQLQGQTLLADLYKNGEPVQTDIALSLHGCLSTALWLARKLTALGRPLRAGDVLLTGALAPIAEIARGDRLCFQVTGLGEVTCSFS